MVRNWKCAFLVTNTWCEEPWYCEIWEENLTFAPGWWGISIIKKVIISLEILTRNESMWCISTLEKIFQQMGGTNTIQLSKDSALLSRNRRTSMWWVLSVEVWIPQWLPSGALSPRSPRFSTGHVVTPWLQNWWRRFMWMKHVSKDSMQWLVEVHTTYFDVLWLCLYKV